MTAGVSRGGGEPAARFAAELRRYVARRVPGPDADDVLQEVLLRIHLGVGAVREQERLAPWVYRVARSVVIDHHRRRLAPAAPADEDVPDELDDTEPEAARALLAACVEPFLDGLPPEQAEALRLTDLGTLTQLDAARQLGVPLPTLKARVQRGRRRMRAAFEACCDLERDARGSVVDLSPRCGCA